MKGEKMTAEMLLFWGGFLFFVIAIVYIKVKGEPSRQQYQLLTDKITEVTTQYNNTAQAIVELQGKVASLEKPKDVDLPPAPAPQKVILSTEKPLQVEFVPHTIIKQKKELGKGMDSLIRPPKPPEVRRNK